MYLLSSGPDERKEIKFCADSISIDISFFGDAMINVVLGAKLADCRISVGSVLSQNYDLMESFSKFTPIHNIQGVGLLLVSEA